MLFDISFLDQKIGNSSEIGSITIGDFIERLIIPTSYWGRQQYENQWMQSLSLIIQGPETISAGLITEIYPKNRASYMNVWPVYRVGDDVYIQNRLLFLDENPGLNEGNIQEYLEEREVIDAEGNPISEWKVALEDIRAWIKRG